MAGCQDVKAELPSPPRAADVKHESSGQLLAVKGEEEQMKQLQLAAEGATLENFREKAYKYASSVMKLCGGPWQYLQKAFPSAEAKAEFAQYLRATYSSRYDLEYCHGPAQLPKDDTVRFCLSPADLSFEAGSSTKPPPQRHTALSLLDEILTRGFVTQGQTTVSTLCADSSLFWVFVFLLRPLFQSESLASGDEILLWQSQLKDTTDMGTGDENFWTSYVKGACRCGTLLYLLAIVRSAGWELAVPHPTLYETVCVVHARCDTCFWVAFNKLRPSYHYQ